MAALRNDEWQTLLIELPGYTVTVQPCSSLDSLGQKYQRVVGEATIKMLHLGQTTVCDVAKGVLCPQNTVADLVGGRDAGH